MKSLVILGRQPALGIAELESLYGAKTLRPVSNDAVMLDIAPESVDFARLGGSVKLCKVLNILDYTEWPKIEAYLSETIPKHLQHVPDGKLKLGLSAFGLRVRTQDINATGLRLKKIIKAEGRSVRIVPNKSTELNSAQVLHNQLTSPTGWELVLVRDGKQTILAQTVAEQDIDAYAKRDQQRPMRDAKVGMLPPKLAQVLVNLAVGQVQGGGFRVEDGVILDPFCGTGVLLQEALLMGYAAYGTDLEPRMIEYSKQNIAWLANSYSAPGHLYSILLEQGDATTHQWQQPVDVVACETYLGKPLSSLPPRTVLDKIIAECDQIHQRFLHNIAGQLTPGTRLALGVPAWKTRDGFLHLKTLANLDKLGYTRKSFVHSRTSELIYHRPDQVVARELVILEKT